jgi:ABC-type multidrug transport system ATPase subunit
MDIRVQNLAKKYDTQRAVDGISFDVNQIIASENTFTRFS